MENNLPPIEPFSPVVPPPLIAPPPPPLAPPPRKSGRSWLSILLVLCVIGALVLFVVVRRFTHIHLGNMGGASASEMTNIAGRPYQQQMIEDNEAKDNILVIEVGGVISGGADQSGFDLVGSIKDQLRIAAEEDSIKAVILKVDSPGGEVLASDEIYRAIQEFQEEYSKPVIAQMGSMAASGGYYISAPCRWIVANELTITGSIGVIMQSLNYRGLMDKVGVAPMTFKSGKFKDMLSSEKPLGEISAEEKKMIQDLIDETFGRFKSVVAIGRKQAEEANDGEGRALATNWKDYADGRILSGTQALELGFVDELGNFDDAVARALKIAKIEDANLVRYAQPFDFLNMLRIFGKSGVGNVKVNLGVEMPKILAGRMYFLSPLVLH